MFVTIYLIVEDEFTEGRDVLCPLDQDEQLLLHALPDVGDVGQPLGGDVVVSQLVTHLVTVVTLGRSVCNRSLFLAGVFLLPFYFCCVKSTSLKPVLAVQHRYKWS